GPELDVFHGPVGVDRDRGGPAADAISLGDLLKGVLHKRKRQREALAGIVGRLAVSAAMKRDDERRLRARLGEVLQTLQFGEAGRRPRLPEIEQDVTASEALQGVVITTVGERD